MACSGVATWQITDDGKGDNPVECAGWWRMSGDTVRHVVVVALCSTMRSSTAQSTVVICSPFYF